LIQALSTDVTVIVSGAKLFPQLLTNAVTLMGMLGYLAYLSVDIFTFVIKVIVFGVIAHQIPSWIGTRYFYRAREHRDVLQEAFKGLVEGAKELKLNDHKKRQFNDRVLDRQEQIVTGLDKKGSTVHALADNFGELLSFFAIGGLAFVFVDRNDIAASQVVGAVMVLLYITGPVSTLLNFIPQLASVRISLKKIDALYRELPDEQVCQTAKPLPSWQCLRFENVGYTYPSADNDPLDQQNPGFAVGPLNLEIKAGQITFITGGNGSGKSTLAKLVTAHYLADQGEIYCDQIKIERHNINALRQQIGCIYADYHLFEQLLDSRSQCPQYLERANHYLKAFGIDHKVSIENGRFTTLQLSDGQRRRLALVVAILDDKKLLLFDEWAADQDPQFKRVFYRQILADLKQQNKAVVVISHDDRYFDVADQIIVMEQGMSSSSDTVKQPNVSVDKADSKYRELEYNGENYNYEG
ncbi:MAG: cyclic peptide export ABC transporter, partial [Algicola sp.]|nr:cyclic peptide export ABC transporter [Algicola sp.]